MTDSIKRRDFIKNLSLAGASVAIANPLSAEAYLPGIEHEIKNDHFTVSFDKKNGTINIYRNNGLPLLLGGTACVNSDNNKRFDSPATYKYSFDSKAFTDQLGTGKRLIVSCKDKNKKSDLEIQLSLYDGLETITVEVICKNVSDHDTVIDSIEPLRAIKNEDGMLNVPGVLKCITNGEMYYDTGAIHEFGTKDDAISSGNLKGIKLANGPISAQSETIHSWWNKAWRSGMLKMICVWEIY